MVRDAYSEDVHQPSSETESSNTQGQPLDLRGSSANLTQELAQLLAASIAQGQTGQRAGTPTGAELASLAALVSASQNQRALAPSFKDGLSSLSYSAPQRAPEVHGHGVQFTEHHDDEPMPIPSTWRQPTVSNDDRWYRQQVGAAVLGLVAGLMVVVPAVLWLSGWLGGPQTRASTARQQPAAEQTTAEIKTADVKPVRVQVRPVERSEVTAQYVAAAVEPRPIIIEPPPVVEKVPAPLPQAEPSRPRAEELVAQAERRIASGDIAGAREVLASNDAAASGPITFALAETYDPNMLAAWGTRGVAADVTKARSLYFKARDLGVVRAQVRLDQLK
jgi:hypothetical protein